MSDLISRQAAIDALKVAYWDKDIQSAKDDPCIVDAMTDWAIRQIKALPTIEPERKKAKLIRRMAKGGWVDNICSECGTIFCARKSQVVSFCNNCGAELSGGDPE